MNYILQRNNKGNRKRIIYNRQPRVGECGRMAVHYWKGKAFYCGLYFLVPIFLHNKYNIP